VGRLGQLARDASFAIAKQQRPATIWHFYEDWTGEYKDHENDILMLTARHRRSFRHEDVLVNGVQIVDETQNASRKVATGNREAVWQVAVDGDAPLPGRWVI
jgi:hypothetical protein